VRIGLDLVVKDASELVDLDNRRASVVMDNTALPIVIKDALLLQLCVARVLLGQRILVPDRDMRVDEGITGRDSNHTTRVVSLLYIVEFKPPRSRLVVNIAHTIVLLVPIENAFTVRCWVGLAWLSYRLVVRIASCLPLQTLLLLDRVAIAVGLAVHITVRPGKRSSLDERTFRDVVKAA